MDVLLTAAQRVGAPVMLRGRDWRIAPGRYEDALGVLDLPPPSLPGAFQLDNAGIAIAAMRASGLAMDATGVARAEWPARLQRLHGRLAALLPADWELWLDGGHNPGAGVVLAEHLRTLVGSAGACRRRHEADEGRHRIPAAAGSICNHAVGGGRTWAARCAAGRGDHRSVGRRRAAGSTRRGRSACAATRRPARVLICGSLYLAGEVLKLDA